jgi:hypothetical protein
MPTIEGLIAAYSRFVQLPWDRSVSGSERVWLAIYPPREERRLRARIGEFEIATKAAGHGWTEFDLKDEFAAWMAKQEYREAYFEDPEALEPLLDSFGDELTERVRERLDEDENTVVGLIGLGSLFGLYKVSHLLERVNEHIRGRLLAFFPGERDNGNYRLLDARDGWNYLAVPIEAED